MDVLKGQLLQLCNNPWEPKKSTKPAIFNFLNGRREAASNLSTPRPWETCPVFNLSQFLFPRRCWWKCCWQLSTMDGCKYHILHFSWWYKEREREIFILMDGLGVAIIKTQIQNFFAGLMKCLGCHECRWGERRQIWHYPYHRVIKLF